MKNIVIITILFLAGAIMNGCITAQENTNSTANPRQIESSETEHPYQFPEFIYPEQVSFVVEGEGGTLYAAVNEINKYADRAAVLKYDLNPKPEISDEYAFLGILRSTDGGNTWEESLSFTPDPNHKRLESIATCSQDNRDVAYAYFESTRVASDIDKAASMHIYVSQDDGVSWEDKGIFALKNGNELDVVSVTLKDQTEAQPIPLATLLNLQAEKGDCGNVFFRNNEGTDTIRSDDYGATWQRTKTE